MIANAQSNHLNGYVFTIEAKGKKIPLVGASVHWKGTTQGTVTNSEGEFVLLKSPTHSNNLIVRYVGYESDTLKIDSISFIEVEMKAGKQLRAVEISRRDKSTNISMLATRKTENLSQKELHKAACCNLSESFETSPSVDVSFTDAVTGTRQIQMLGLAGVYSQITRENMPDVRGLSSVSGLTYIPGTWVHSIQLNKGAGSVVNGYESITGQINTELHRYSTLEKFFVNGYINNESRMELNAHLKKKFGKNLKGVLLLHGSANKQKLDHNEDGFMDMPLNESFIALNRWEVDNKHDLHIEFGGKFTYVDKLSGQMDFSPSSVASVDSIWGMKSNLMKIEAWSKVGRVHPLKRWQSTALQMTASHQEEESSFGFRSYQATQSSFYANLIHQGYLKGANHQFKTGLSLQIDDITETFVNTLFIRNEIVPGAFFEYNWKPKENFDMLYGLRYDHHSIFGGFVTPRVHLRWEFAKKAVLRASGGRGQRTANVFAENIHMLATSRTFELQQENLNNPYGLDPEVAWNYGLNLTKSFKLNYKEGSVSVDYYRTDFENQIIIDLEQDAHKVMIYNLKGSSYANSFQAQVDYELFKRFDLRLAYRFFDVKSTYGGVLKDKPLISQHRAFANFAYSSRKHWSYDLTVNWQGEKRVPSLSGNPVTYQVLEKSPSFFMFNAQITKEWREKIAVYVGAENILDYVQENPIVAASDPFGKYFDSSLIWGPVFGRKLYLGVRYTLK